MLKCLSKIERIRRAGFYTQAAEGAHIEVVDMPIDSFTGFAIHFFRFGNYLNGAIGAIYLADAASGALMLVFFVVRHYNFAFEPVEHTQRCPIFGVLLSNYGTRAHKVAACNPHPTPKGSYSA